MGAKYVFNPLTGNLDTTDVVAFNGEVNLGTAAAPSVFFTGDSNTGIYSPGADQLAISTNGSGRLFVDASGRVGMGTASPARQFTVYNSTVPIIQLVNSTTGDTVNDGVMLYEAGSDFVIENQEAGEIKILNNGSQRVTIDSSGRLGLGTSTPLAPVHFASSVTGSDGDSKGVILSLVNTATAVAGTGSSVSFGCNLATSGTSVAVNIASIEGIKENGINGNFAGALKFVTRAHAGSPTERMRINSSGNVGIGTTSPGVALHVDGDIRCDGVYGETDTNTSIQFPGSDVITFNEGGSEAARIDSDGRLLVGTSTARTSFYNGTGKSSTVQFEATHASPGTQGRFVLSNNTTGAQSFEQIFVKSGAATAGSHTLVADDDRLGLISFQGTDGSEPIAAVSIEAYVDGTPGANDMPGRLVFSSTPSGSATPVERMRIASDGALWIGTTTGTIDTGNFGTNFRGDNRLDHSRNTTSTVAQFFGSAGQARIMGDGDLENTNNRYTGISDVKLKQNIEDASSQWNDIRNIRVRKYELIANPDRRHIGVVAQELEEICPGLVIERDLDEETGETVKSVAYSVLYMKAVKALQEAMERIETLEQRLNDAGIA